MNKQSKSFDYSFSGLLHFDFLLYVKLEACPRAEKSLTQYFLSFKVIHIQNHQRTCLNTERVLKGTFIRSSLQLIAAK